MRELAEWQVQLSAWVNRHPYLFVATGMFVFCSGLYAVALLGGAEPVRSLCIVALIYFVVTAGCLIALRLGHRRGLLSTDRQTPWYR